MRWQKQEFLKQVQSSRFFQDIQKTDPQKYAVQPRNQYTRRCRKNLKESIFTDIVSVYLTSWKFTMHIFIQKVIHLLFSWYFFLEIIMIFQVTDPKIFTGMVFFLYKILSSIRKVAFL